MTAVDEQWAMENAPPVQSTDPKLYQWATFIQDRSPQFKIHRNIGHARSAIGNRARMRDYLLIMTASCALYRLVDGEWRPESVFSCGDKLNHFPWQQDPGSAQERMTADAKRGVENILGNLRYLMGRLNLSESLRTNLDDEVRIFTNRVREVLK